jgi:ubiquinone/menaquinone biosynthesis C-methylase UbiE
MSLDEVRARSLALWDEMAAGWDQHRSYLWDVSRRVGEWMVEQADPKVGDIILELACGPGDTGFVAARLVGDNGKVIATDFSPEMVEVAKRRAQELGLTNVDFRVMDAEHMDLPDDSVDVVLCRWGFMLMADPQQALGESRRVLRDGGRLAFSVWGKPEENPWMLIPGMTMMKLGHQLRGDPTGPGGIFSMADQDKITDMVSSAGFHDIKIENMAVEWTSDSFEDAWTFMTAVAGPLAALIKELPPDRIDELKTALEQEMAPFKRAMGYATPGVTVNVAAS